MRRSVQILAASAMAAIWLAPIAAPTRAWTDQIKTTMTVSPKVAWNQSEVVYTATVAPVSNPVANLVFQFRPSGPGSASGACTPVENCTLLDTGPRWTFPLLTAKVTVTLGAYALQPDQSMLLVLEGPADSSCYGPCGSASVAWPTVTSRVTVSPPGVVMPGDTLHFVVSGSSNLADNTGQPWTEGVLLSAGLGPPTNVVPTLTSPPWTWNAGVIDGQVPSFQTSSTKWVEFDTVVTAAVGSKVSVRGINGFTLGYTLVSKPLTILVGPQPTPTPRQTPKPPPKATAGSPHASPPASEVATAAVTDAPPSELATMSGTIGPSGPVDTKAPTDPPATPDGSLVPTAASSGPDLVWVLVAILGAGLLFGLGVYVAVHRRRRLRAAR